MIVGGGGVVEALNSAWKCSSVSMFYMVDKPQIRILDATIGLIVILNIKTFSNGPNFDLLQTPSYFFYFVLLIDT